ncbi:phage replisome organizer N-terminal domain-containing protein [Enterococcus cecorum]
MASVKRFFWLKLKEDFFKQKEIKLLRKIAGGDTYTIIYLKILLLSLKNNGKVYFEGVTDNFFEEIALEIDEDIENVAICMKFLEQKGLLIYDTEDSASLTAIPEMIGSESESARRVRKHRQNKVLQEKTSQCNGSSLQSNKNVTTEKELEKELEKEKEKELQQETETSGQLSLSPLFEFWESNGFGMLAPKTRQDLAYWVKDFQEIGATEQEAVELVQEALNLAINANARRYNYVNGILKNWEAKRYTNVKQVNADRKASAGMRKDMTDKEREAMEKVEREAKENPNSIYNAF